MVRVLVIEDRFRPGGGPGRLVELGEALMRRWRSDAHFQQCESPSAVRLTKSHVRREPISIEAIAFDIDGPAHAASEAWWRDERAKIARLPGSPFAYRTRGGYRLVWRLSEPYEIKSSDDAHAWKLRYRAACDLLERFGIHADRSCSDFSRLFRLPHVLREPGQGIEDLEVTGDPKAIGCFELPAPSEQGKHQSSLSEQPHANRERKPTARSAWVEGCILARLLDRRGDLVNVVELDRGGFGFQVRCPNRRAHRPGRSDNALLILPNGEGVGRIVCQRTGCTHLSGDDWLRCFAPGELFKIGLRVGTITRHFFDQDRIGRPRLAVDLEPIDGGRPISYLRISSGTGAWRALWKASDLDDPIEGDDLDLKRQAAALRGVVLALKLDEAGRTRRIYPGGEGR